MTKRDKLIARIVARPSTASFQDVRPIWIMFGWEHASSQGSHHRFAKPGERSIIVPVKHGTTVKRHYLDEICIRLGLDQELEDH